MSATDPQVQPEEAATSPTAGGPTGTSRGGSRDARAAVVAAAAALLREGGVAAVTTRAVTQAAGMQAPAIYRLFGDKDGLLDAVAEHVMATWVAEKARTAQAVAAADGDPVADLVAGYRSQVDFGLANPDLYALLNTPGRAQRSPATTAGEAILAARLRRLAAAGLLAVDERRALGMLRAAGTGTVTALLGVAVGERDQGLSGAVMDAVLDAVLVPGARPRARAETAGETTGARPEALTPLTAAVALLAHLPDLPGLSGAERALMTEQLERALAALPTT